MITEIFDCIITYPGSLDEQYFYFTGKSFASKVVDIDPPTKLQDLREDQEIKIGLRISDSDKFNSKYHPSCAWYDEKSKQDDKDKKSSIVAISISFTGYNDP